MGIQGVHRRTSVPPPPSTAQPTLFEREYIPLAPQLNPYSARRGWLPRTRWAGRETGREVESERGKRIPFWFRNKHWPQAVDRPGHREEKKASWRRQERKRRGEARIVCTSKTDRQTDPHIETKNTNVRCHHSLGCGSSVIVNGNPGGAQEDIGSPTPIHRPAHTL